MILNVSMMPGLILYLIVVIHLSLFLGCGTQNASELQNAINEFERGVNTKDRGLLASVLYERVEIIAPDENRSVPRDDFVDQVFLRTSNLVEMSLRVDQVRISGNRASVRIQETEELLFPERSMKTVGN